MLITPLGTSITVSLGGSTTSVGASAVADVNSDGTQDVVTTNHNANTISVQLGSSSSGLTPMTTVNVGTTPTDVAITDFNGDRVQDILRANPSSNTVTVPWETTKVV